MQISIGCVESNSYCIPIYKHYDCIVLSTIKLLGIWCLLHIIIASIKCIEPAMKKKTINLQSTELSRLVKNEKLTCCFRFGFNYRLDGKIGVVPSTFLSAEPIIDKEKTETGTNDKNPHSPQFSPLGIPNKVCKIKQIHFLFLPTYCN